MPYISLKFWVSEASHKVFFFFKIFRLLCEEKIDSLFTEMHFRWCLKVYFSISFLNLRNLLTEGTRSLFEIPGHY